MEGEKLFTYIRSKGKLNADYSIKDIYNFYIDLLKNSFIDNKRKVIELKTDVYNYEYLCYNV
jgi:hypothetical protein